MEAAHQFSVGGGKDGESEKKYTDCNEVRINWPLSFSFFSRKKKKGEIIRL